MEDFKNLEPIKINVSNLSKLNFVQYIGESNIIHDGNQKYHHEIDRGFSLFFLCKRDDIIKRIMHSFNELVSNVNYDTVMMSKNNCEINDISSLKRSLILIDLNSLKDKDSGKISLNDIQKVYGICSICRTKQLSVFVISEHIEPMIIQNSNHSFFQEDLLDEEKLNFIRNYTPNFITL